MKFLTFGARSILSAFSRGSAHSASPANAANSPNSSNPLGSLTGGFWEGFRRWDMAHPSPTAAPPRRHWLRGREGSPLVRGALEALLVPMAFVALGLAWWGGVERAHPASPVYPAVLMESVPREISDPPPADAASAAEPAVENPSRVRRVHAHADAWLIDGFNVVQVGLLRDRARDRWWSAERREELMARVAQFEHRDAPLWVVFDGSRPAPESPAEARIHSVFAPSADAWLVSRVKQAENPEQLVVVTADRRLANRVRHHGAQVISPGDFLSACSDEHPVAEELSSV